MNNCLYCNKEHNNPKFCNSSCSAKYNNSKRVDNKSETRSQTLQIKAWNNGQRSKLFPYSNVRFITCAVCEKLFCYKNKTPIKTCSLECREKIQSEMATNNLRKRRLRGETFDFRKGSWMENSFSEWLLQKGIPENRRGVLREVYFKYDGRWARADFVFPTLKVVIELDGTQHRNQKEKDNARDAALKKRGWDTLRVSYKEYKNNAKTEIIENILEPLAPAAVF